MSAKILIVDDEPNLLRMLSYTLQGEGYEIITAPNGGEALNKVKIDKPDLVILDVMLPDMTGLEVCTKLRHNEETITLPVIMLSARTQVPDKISGLEAGADEYVTKPIKPEELVARVKAILRRYRLLRSSQSAQPGIVVACLGAKGGVGTTTMVLNIATALATQAKKTVAAEIRSSLGTLAAQLNLAPSENLRSLLELEPAQIREREVSKCLIHLPSGLRLLFGPQNAGEYREIEPQQMEALIDTLSSMADFVLLDLPCHPTAATQAAIKRCHFTVLVAEPEPACLVAAKGTLELIKSWGVAGRQVGLMIVNRSPLTAPVKLSEIETQLGREIFATIPTASDAFMAAVRKGVPMVLFHPDNLAAMALSDVAKKISAFK
jgi:CheY-like chemotaxis protein